MLISSLPGEPSLLRGFLQDRKLPSCHNIQVLDYKDLSLRHQLSEPKAKPAPPALKRKTETGGTQPQVKQQLNFTGSRRITPHNYREVKVRPPAHLLLITLVLMLTGKLCLQIEAPEEKTRWKQLPNTFLYSMDTPEVTLQCVNSSRSCSFSSKNCLKTFLLFILGPSLVSPTLLKV